jgi:hypothetical protein
MKTLNPFLPTSAQPATVPSQLTRAGGALYLVNQSNNNYTIDFQNGNTATLVAQFARLYRLAFPLNGFVVSVQSTVVAPPLSSPQVWGEAFQAGEDTSGLFTGPLTNDILALGQPSVFSLSNVNNQSFNQANLPGLTFYLSGFEITMDKTGTPASGIFTISGLANPPAENNQLNYWLVQSNQQVWIKEDFKAPLAGGQGVNGPMTFMFPNLTASIGFNFFGWYQ